MLLVFEIVSWNWSFSFGINRSRIRDDLYMDFPHIEISGSLFAPKKVKADRAELCIIPRPNLNHAARQSNQPAAVGSPGLYGRKLRGYISTPMDTLESIPRTLHAGKLRSVVMNGDHLRYRKGLLHGFLGFGCSQNWRRTTYTE